MNTRLFAAAMLAMVSVAGAAKPNILVAIADDIGLGDVSYYRSKHLKANQKLFVNTPNIDQLAADGMAFTNGHSPASLCSPSRYAIMTGRFSFRSPSPWGVWSSFAPSPIKATDLTLGEVMQNAGYTTGFFGKLHLGGDYLKQGTTTGALFRRGSTSAISKDEVDATKIVGGTPHYFGYDYSLLMPAGIQDVPYVVYEDAEWLKLKPDSELVDITKAGMLEKGVKLDKNAGVADSNWHPKDMGPLLANKGVEFIKKHAKDAKPFFMHYNSQAVHLPHNPIDELNNQKVEGATQTRHLDMVVELDVQLGMLVDALKEEGIYNNTLIIFSSDNGGLVFSEKIGHRTSDIYSGSKNIIREGGNRVPFIATWPDKITAGNMTNELVMGQDIMATLADIAGYELPKDQALDSESFLPLLLAEDGAKGRSFGMIQGGTNSDLALVQGDWKLVVKFGCRKRLDVKRNIQGLWNLKTDVREQNNLMKKAEHKERLDAMYATFNIKRDCVGRSADCNGVQLPEPTEPTMTPVDVVTADEFSFAKLPTSFPAGTTDFAFEFNYAAVDAREIFTEIRDPANVWLTVKKVPVPAGRGKVTVVLTLNPAPPAGTGYLLKSHLRPVGKTWQDKTAGNEHQLFDIV